MSNYATIKKFDIANGEGIRVSIFFSGCTHHCKDCFNKELWDFRKGEPFTREVYEQKIKPLITKHIKGLSILGGEPFDRYDLFFLVSWFKEDFPDKDIWVWSGYTIEEILSEDFPRNRQKAIYWIDTLVDGKFIEELKDYRLEWRGSSNQRIIDVKKEINKWNNSKK